ncbi:MAG: cysteine desulfurase NifS [Clostridia bacterium]|nr:cysteine desulfurase NifS [Clostridia bacterium]
MKKIIYFDNAATTNVTPKVLESMLPFYKDNFGNPSSIYSLGRDAYKAIDKAREDIAKCIGADKNEIYFTSGGSESDNWAIKGVAYTLAKTGKNHIITSKIEHHAVLHTVEALFKEGFEVTYLDVDSDGLVSPESLKNAIREDTALVSIIYANNEIGTIQDIDALAEVCKDRGVISHTDAVQAVGHVPINVKKQGIDLLSISGHKFHGPKGVGALYIKKGIKLGNLIEGGAQENGRRAGTENVAGIVGLSVALQDACDNMAKRNEQLIKMREVLIEELSKIDRSRLNGHRTKRLAGNVNMCFEGIEGESLLLMLDAAGICASSGSACTSGSLDPSHVLLAIGLPHEVAHGSLRLSLSDINTPEEVEYALSVIPSIVDKLRSMSPLWERIISKGK